MITPNRNTVFFLIILASAVILTTGCDEGMKMAGPMMMEPAEKPADTPPTMMGDMKQPEPETPAPSEQDPETPEEPAEVPEEPETPVPTLTISTAMTMDDGSVTISGTSTDLPVDEVVTITIGETLTVTAVVNEDGMWSVMVPATETMDLVAGTTTVTAVADTATTESSFEYTSKQLRAEQIMTDIINEVFFEYTGETATNGEKRILQIKHKDIKERYGPLFDVETEVGYATFKRFAEYEYKTLGLLLQPQPFKRELELLDQYFEETFGFSTDYAKSLVFDIYLEEKPEDRKYIGSGWQHFDIAMEYLLLQIANPDATEEDLHELLRESIREGNVTIAT